MKATELMIGDWFKVIEHFEPWIESLYVRVEGINTTPHPFIETEYQIKGRKGFAFIRFHPEHIEPIPLTEDILKANGAKFQQPKYLLLGGFSMWLSDKEGCYMTRMGAAGVADNWVYFHYVHELQHALRLCGLNELADNFKID